MDWVGFTDRAVLGWKQHTAQRYEQESIQYCALLQH